MAPKKNQFRLQNRSATVQSKRKRQPPVKLRELFSTNDPIPTTLPIDKLQKQQAEIEKPIVAQSETQKLLMQQQKEILDLLKIPKTDMTTFTVEPRPTCISSINDDSNDEESNDAGSESDRDSGDTCSPNSLWNEVNTNSNHTNSATTKFQFTPVKLLQPPLQKKNKQYILISLANFQILC